MVSGGRKVAYTSNFLSLTPPKFCRLQLHINAQHDWHLKIQHSVDDLQGGPGAIFQFEEIETPVLIKSTPEGALWL